MEKWTFFKYLQIFRLKDILFTFNNCTYNASKYYLDTEEIKLISKNYDTGKNLYLALLKHHVWIPNYKGDDKFKYKLKSLTHVKHVSIMLSCHSHISLESRKESRRICIKTIHWIREKNLFMFTLVSWIELSLP